MAAKLLTVQLNENKRNVTLHYHTKKIQILENTFFCSLWDYIILHLGELFGRKKKYIRSPQHWNDQTALSLKMRGTQIVQTRSEGYIKAIKKQN